MSQLKNHAERADLLVTPTLSFFRDQQRQILTNAKYDPTADDLRYLDGLLRREAFDMVLEVASELYDIWHLSPKYHYLVGNAAHACGDDELKLRSQRLFQTCLEMLLETGDGSAQDPYDVTYFSDEHDILAILDGRIRSQALVGRAGEAHDVVTLHDGTDIWFAIEPLRQQAQRFRREQAKIAV